jgi:chromosome segregation ATPase
MQSKSDLQTILKDRYGINKNVTQALSRDECEQLLILLNDKPAARNLVAAFIQKNHELSNNNRALGKRRENATKKLEQLTREYQRLEASIAKQEEKNETLAQRKVLLAKEEAELQQKIEELTQRNQRLESRVQTLTTHNDELVDANERLQKDNKALKNILDQIRLRLARDIDELLRYEDSELRKAMIRLLKWTLG